MVGSGEGHLAIPSLSTQTNQIDGWSTLPSVLIAFWSGLSLSEPLCFASQILEPMSGLICFPMWNYIPGNPKSYFSLVIMAKSHKGQFFGPWLKKTVTDRKNCQTKIEAILSGWKNRSHMATYGYIWANMVYNHIWPWFRSQRHSKAVFFNIVLKKRRTECWEKIYITTFICINDASL